MHDTASSSLQPALLREEAVTAAPPLSDVYAHAASSAKPEARPRGYLQKLAGFFARLFAGKRNKDHKSMPVIAVEDDRARAALAAQMQPPMAFRGDTASTLATPMGAYAGKPVEQAIRKRAEQQFKNMDITSATMN
jgi:hypothetical protein